MIKPLNTQQSQQVFDIREVFPYLASFHNQKFVLNADAGLLLGENSSLVDDIVLLISSGLRFVVIPDESALLAKFPKNSQTGQPIINSDNWSELSRTLAVRHFRIIANLTRALRKRGSKAISIASGCYIHAKPRGVFGGVDLGRNGRVRSVDLELINQDLIPNQLVLISALSPTSTGHLYWISAEELGEKLAITINAHKWLIVAEANIRRFFPDTLIKKLAPKTLQRTKSNKDINIEIPSQIIVEQLDQELRDCKENSPLLSSAVSAINDGVGRVNLIAFDEKKNRNNLLCELFTHKGCGTVISNSPLESIRKASIDDVSGIFAILQPLEEDGTMATRTIADIEKIINHFIVMLHDGLIIACAALVPIAEEKHSVELAAFAVLAAQQKRGVGKKMLDELLQIAKKSKYKNIYLLTARTHEWFQEFGFRLIDVKKLPHAKQSNYDKNRCSKVMLKKL